MRRNLLAAAALLLLAVAPAAAYTIILKDGSRMVARQKYTVAGDKANIVMQSGARTVLPLADIDVDKTNRANASDFGSALVVEGPDSRPQPTATPRGPTLSEVAGAGRLPEPQRAAPPAAAPVPAAAPRAATGQPRTGSGAVDLMRASRQPVTRMGPATQLSELLRAKGIETVSLYEGTQPGRVLLDVMTNSEGAVFHALNAISEAVVELETRSPGAVDAVEVFMATERRQRAGQFLLTPERARELVDKRLEVTAFFTKYVEF
jgi:hypothetical protein